MKGNRLMKLIKKYQRIYGEDPEILFRGVFGYSDVAIMSLTDNDAVWRDARGRAVCVIEGSGQGRTYPTLALDEIEQQRTVGSIHHDNDTHTLHNVANAQRVIPSMADIGIPDDISQFVRETTETIINHRIMHPEHYANTQRNSQENFN